MAEQKRVILILNGSGTKGKNEFAKCLGKYKNVFSTSSIDKVKEAATVLGWEGKKDEKSRKFLSDMKLLATEYNDFPFKDISKLVKLFKRWYCDYDIMTIDIREPEEIARAVKEFGAISVLIKRDCVEDIKSNMADANVYNYDYDYVIENNGTIEDLKKEAKNLIDKLFGEETEESK